MTIDAMFRVRRRRVLILQATEELAVDVASLLRGGLELRRMPQLALLCPIRGRCIALEPEELALVMTVPDHRWVSADMLHASPKHAAVVLDLARRGILLSDPPQGDSSDLVEGESVIADAQWSDLAAVFHAHTTWRGVNSLAADTTNSEETVARVAGVPAFFRRSDILRRIPMTVPKLEDRFFDVLLARRTTRSFRSEEPLPREALETVLYAVFGAHGFMESGGMSAIKRSSPSGGALHPIEAYILVMNVGDVPAGLYHYETATHALAQLELLPMNNARELAVQFTAGQAYFAKAHALIIHVARFERSFAKYSRHKKAYGAVLMDSAHLSQSLYLTATAIGLGAFYTAAINDGDIGSRLRLRQLREAPVGINGIGLPGELSEDLHFTADRYTPIAVDGIPKQVQ
jgi:putative peptide maturation dehydrogenase